MRIAWVSVELLRVSFVEVPFFIYYKLPYIRTCAALQFIVFRQNTNLIYQDEVSYESL